MQAICVQIFATVPQRVSHRLRGSPRLTCGRLERVSCETAKGKETSDRRGSLNSETPERSGARPSLATPAVILQKLPKSEEFLSNPTAM